MEGSGMDITVSTQMEEAEKMAYVDYLEKKYGKKIESLNIEVDGEFVNLDYKFQASPPFERIRRITGYLVGTMDRWNDAKRAEERDRVQHTL